MRLFQIEMIARPVQVDDLQVDAVETVLLPIRLQLHGQHFFGDAVSGTLDTVEAVYRRVDEALGSVIAAAGPDARVMIFSTEGLCAENFDLQNLVFLPELLFRHSFPGCKGLDFDPRRELSPESQAGIKDWVMEIWHQRRRPLAVETWLRDRLRLPISMRLLRWFGLQPPLYHPLSTTFWNFASTNWSIPYRRYMKAFALITASDGCIRLNVRGREKHGLIRADEFAETCDDIENILHELRDPHSGERAVKNVFRIRTDPFAWGKNDHDADLVVTWQPVARAQLVSPHFGNFGPVPFHRTSAHTPDGFIAVKGPGIGRGTLPVGSPLDVAPTILALAGARSGSLPGQCVIPLHSQRMAA